LILLGKLLKFGPFPFFASLIDTFLTGIFEKASGPRAMAQDWFGLVLFLRNTKIVYYAKFVLHNTQFLVFSSFLKARISLIVTYGLCNRERPQPDP
jgi:hypothetical protein